MMRPIKFFIFALVAVAGASAAPAAPSTAPAPINITKPMLDDRVTSLEADIGRLMQKRVDDSAGVPRELELRIDVRIIARWFAARAADAQPGSEMQACAWIRCGDLLAAAALVEQQIDTANRAAASELPAVKALHDLTFKLGDAKTVAEIDTVSRAAATALLAVMGGDATTARLPMMRPNAEAAAVDETQSGVRASRTLEQLAARSRQLAVSPSLRAQLLGFAQAAQKLSQDPKRQAEFPEMRAMLEDAVTLAEGLQSNTAVDREDRVKMEAQVAQGLAMFLDPRTRKLGQQHVAGLAQYRRMVETLRELKLPQDLMKRVGPALAWARTNPESGAGITGAIELFLHQDARFTAPSAPAHELSGLFAKAAAEAKRRAADAREAFLTSAASPATFQKPESLRKQAEAMQKALDAFDAISRAPDAIRTLNAYRPRPFGGIEKRVQVAANAWANDSNPSDVDRDAGTQFLTELLRLADFASELNHPTTAPAVDETTQAYVGDSLNAFQARRKTIVAELVNSTAAGHVLDDAALAPLETARAMLAAVESAKAAEQGVAQAEVLQRWVDWGVDRDTVNGVLDTYRKTTAEAFSAFAHSSRRPVEEWVRLRPRYDALVALLSRVAARAEECRALPSGRTGALAKLMTPLADQPFANERGARVVLDAWSYHAQHKDEKAADTALDALAARLTR